MFLRNHLFLGLGFYNINIRRLVRVLVIGCMIVMQFCITGIIYVIAENPFDDSETYDTIEVYDEFQL